MECEKCKERDLVELDYGYLEPELFSRDRLEMLLTLEQFQKRWGIVRSHLILWDKYEKLKQEMACLLFDKGADNYTQQEV